MLSRFDDEGHFASAPGDRARFLLEMLRDPKRRDVKHSPPEGRAEVAMAKVEMGRHSVKRWGHFATCAAAAERHLQLKLVPSRS